MPGRDMQPNKNPIRARVYALSHLSAPRLRSRTYALQTKYWYTYFFPSDDLVTCTGISLVTSDIPYLLRTCIQYGHTECNQLEIPDLPPTVQLSVIIIHIYMRYMRRRTMIEDHMRSDTLHRNYFYILY